VTTRIAVALSILALGSAAYAQDVSVEKGARIATIGGCHDCHTPGYAESGGVVDPAQALIGSAMGYQGPWGTTYPANLRLVAKEHTEDEFVQFLKTLKARPPMPWFNLHAFDESESRSLYQYIVSLGDAGQPAPSFVPPGEKPTTPYLSFAPVTP
jgi:mono/diheme cytochrome c family protein